MRRYSISLFLLSSVLFCHGQSLVFSDENHFLSFLTQGTYQTEDFNDMVECDNQTFSGFTASSSTVVNCDSDCSDPSMSFLDDFTLNFDSPINAIGFTVYDAGTLMPANVTVETDDGQFFQLLTDFSGGPCNALFFGIISPTYFTSITMLNNVSGDGINIEDLHAGTVSPSVIPTLSEWAIIALFLLLVSIGVLGLQRYNYAKMQIL